jgi:hypothetical protein
MPLQDLVEYFNQRITAEQGPKAALLNWRASQVESRFGDLRLAMTPLNLDSSVDRFVDAMKAAPDLKLVSSGKFTLRVRPLRTRLYARKPGWLRCSSRRFSRGARSNSPFQGAALLRRRALPDGLSVAHSGTSNRGI